MQPFRVVTQRIERKRDEMALLTLAPSHRVVKAEPVIRFIRLCWNQQRVSKQRSLVHSESGDDRYNKKQRIGSGPKTRFSVIHTTTKKENT